MALPTKPNRANLLQTNDQVFSDAWAAAQKDPTKLERLAEVSKQFGKQEDYAAAMQGIKKRNLGKSALKERQANRMAQTIGSIAPRTQQQTATLLSSGQSATATLLG